MAVMSETNVPTMNRTPPAVPPTQASPGFGIPALIAALVVAGSIRGKRAGVSSDKTQATHSHSRKE